MSNIVDFDEQDHDSSEGEGDNKKYESLLSNPSYFSSAMKVRKCVLEFNQNLITQNEMILISACIAEKYGESTAG